MHAVEKIKRQMTEKATIFEQVNELIGRIKLGPDSNRNSSDNVGLNQNSNTVFNNDNFIPGGKQ